MLDCLDEVAEHIFLWLLGVDTAELAAILLHDQLKEGTVLQELLFDVWVLVLGLVDQALQDGLVC